MESRVLKWNAYRCKENLVHEICYHKFLILHEEIGLIYVFHLLSSKWNLTLPLLQLGTRQ